MRGVWHRACDRLTYIEADLATASPAPGDVVVSVHACGALTDRVLDIALDARARVAVLPCCHDLKRCETGPWAPWMDGPLAVDVGRAARLHAHGYKVAAQRIPSEITPKNRLLLGWPP